MERKTLTFITIIFLALIVFGYQITFIAQGISRSDACRGMNRLSMLSDDSAERPEFFKTRSVDSTVIAFGIIKNMLEADYVRDNYPSGVPQSLLEARDYTTERYQQYLAAKERCLGHGLLIPKGLPDLEQLMEEE